MNLSISMPFLVIVRDKMHYNAECFENVLLKCLSLCCLHTTERFWCVSECCHLLLLPSRKSSLLT